MTAPALALYRALTWALGPATGPYLRARARAGKEDPSRLAERRGQASRLRPPGPLVWLHGASVGEAGILLHVQSALAAARPDLAFLFTTGTRTSADLLAKRLPANAIHQFAPMDRAEAVRRFLSHWRPDLGLLAESELWPNTLVEARRAGVRLALINARMSPRSLARWASMPAAARELLGAFSLMLAADARTCEGLTRLAGRSAHLVGNLKLSGPAPGADEAALAALRGAIGIRPVWLAASTREGEEPIVLAAHAQLLEAWPDALLVIAPRHPERSASIQALFPGAKRRSTGALPERTDSVYLADTMGELGTLYALAPAALVAGSLLAQHAGHNPAEPAKIGAAILAGPHVESFKDLYAELGAAGAYLPVRDAAEIAQAVDRLWREEDLRVGLVENARRIVESGASALPRTIEALSPLLPRGAHARA